MLLVDRHHRPWILWTIILALGGTFVYFLADANSSEGLTAGSAIGLVFGVAALVLMLFATALWCNRWSRKGWVVFPRKIWLRGHLWLGSLSVVFVILHAGMRWGGFLTQVLWILTITTIVTGLFGLAMQQFLPRLMSVQIEGEIPALQMEHVCNELRRSADHQVEACCGWEVMDEAIDAAAKQQEKVSTPKDANAAVARFYAVDIRPYLPWRQEARWPLANRRLSEATFARIRGMQLSPELSRALEELEQLCDRRRYLANQMRLHRWLHSWLIVHVPVSLALMLLAIVHAVVSLYY